jgi:CubicO group peptidase (beta-lactamase class C family)
MMSSILKSDMKSKNLIFKLLLFLLVVSFSCKKEISDPDSLSIQLEEIASTAGKGNSNLRCLIVYWDDKILEEKYFQNTNSKTPHDVRSVTKSVISTLIGIAIDKGFIKSENQKIGDYLLPLVPSIDTVKANIKICDVLSMSSGISGDELSTPSLYNMWVTAPDQLVYVLNQPMANQPGSYFNYNSGVSHLMSAILNQATGTSTIAFADENLFKPLGIEKHGWETDNRELNNGAAGLKLTPYEMLKIGQLYLNKGKYNEIQLVSNDWIQKATTFKITTHNIQPFGPDYGYLWWLGEIHSHDYFFANGYGGQFIVVVPDLKLIVIATNNWSGVQSATANQQWYNTLNMIINEIIPLFET